MEVICLTSEAFHALITEVMTRIQAEKSEASPWIGEEDAMKLLGITSKSTLQKLRDTDSIRFSQPMKKVILYHKPSIINYLESHSNK